MNADEVVKHYEDFKHVRFIERPGIEGDWFCQDCIEIGQYPQATDWFAGC